MEGLLSRPGDADALADSVLSLLTNSSLRGRLREAALQRADRFRWERVAEEVEEVYREAVTVGQA